MQQRYANQVTPPKDQPRRPAGINYPVIVRLVLGDASEEWRPGVAIRWPAAAVMVGWQAEPGDSRSMVHAWLPVADVRRVIRRPAR